MASNGETKAHRLLKQAALHWAKAQRYSVVAPEIRVPLSSYRADVAAYRPQRPADAEATLGQTAIFECKQSRADFLKDAQATLPSVERLAQLRRRRVRIEQLLGMHYPSLRCGDSLFPEYESVDCVRMEHLTWQRINRDIQILENRVHHKTKFEKLARYQCANLLYLVTPPGLVDPSEVCTAWGLLEVAQLTAEASDSVEALPVQCHLAKKPQWIAAEPKTRLDLLQRLAASASTRLQSATEQVDTVLKGSEIIA
ncbi:MAG: hypothetical protein P1U82_06670 [Verrucomicrobiales bacterium]|nr:hypothetical protein [Verrucomicrobiales bacterium]